jgi:hypothetical protein
MSLSREVSCIIKGCDATFINSLIIKYINGDNIEEEINNKTLSIVNSYDIKECIKIITKFADFHDICLKLQYITHGEIDISNKIKFHRQITFIYIKKIIKAKITAKLILDSTT